MSSLVQEEVLLTVPNGRALGPKYDELNIRFVRANQVQITSLTPAGAVYNDVNGNLFTGPVVSSVTMAGDVTGNSASNTVAFVGGESAAEVSQSVTDTQSATALATASTIVKRDASGNYASNIANLNALALPNTVNNSVGTITMGGTRVLHGVGALNFFVGKTSGNFTVTGLNNLGVGSSTLVNLSTGNSNVAIGPNSMRGNTTGIENTAVGDESLNDNFDGNFNCAFGYRALTGNISGSNTIAIGHLSLSTSANSVNNIGMGNNAGLNVTDGQNNIFIGHNVGTSTSNGNGNTYISATPINPNDEDNTIRISPLSTRCLIGGIWNSVIPVGSSVIVDPTGDLGTIVSSSKYKQNIATVENSEKLYNLRPVTFTYKSDTANTTQYGLIAEEVADVYPDLVIRDSSGSPNSVRYDFLHALMLREIQKLRADIADLQSRL